MGRAERRPKKPESAPRTRREDAARDDAPSARRRSGISDVLRWMDDAEPEVPTAHAPPPPPASERVARGRRPVQVKKRPAEPAPEPPAPAEPPRAKRKKKRRVSEPALEPIRKRQTGAWGDAGRASEPAASAPGPASPPAPASASGAVRGPLGRRDVEQALSWMDSAESRPLPAAPGEGAPVARERPRTGKVEAVLDWMDQLSGPFEDVKQGRRRVDDAGRPRRSTRRASAEPASPPTPAPRPDAPRSDAPRPVAPRPDAPPRPEGPRAPEERRPTGKLKREAVDEILARADRVRTGRHAPPPAPPPAPALSRADRADRGAELGPPEEGFGPLSASDVWMLAQTPEDVLAGARRPRSDAGPIEPVETPASPLALSPISSDDSAPALEPDELELPDVDLPLPPPLPRLVEPPPLPLSQPMPPRALRPDPTPSDVARATRKAKVEELLEWTQDLLGALEDSGDAPLELEERDPLSTTTDIFEIELDLPDDPPEPDPPGKRSSRLLRLQEQLHARGESLAAAPAPAWSTLPDTDALAHLQARARAAIPPAPARGPSSAEFDPFGGVLPPAPQVARDPRCRDPFCTDPRCLQQPAAPAAPPPEQANGWGQQVRRRRGRAS